MCSLFGPSRFDWRSMIQGAFEHGSIINDDSSRSNEGNEVERRRLDWHGKDCKAPTVRRCRYPKGPARWTGRAAANLNAIHDIDSVAWQEQASKQKVYSLSTILRHEIITEAYPTNHKYRFERQAGNASTDLDIFIAVLAQKLPFVFINNSVIPSPSLETTPRRVRP